MNREYNGVIFTNHALERLRERDISQGDAWAAISRPNRSRPAQKKGNFVFERVFGRRMISVVASKNERKEWVVLSVWDETLRTVQRDKPHWMIRLVKWVWKKLVG